MLRQLLLICTLFVTLFAVSIAPPVAAQTNIAAQLLAESETPAAGKTVTLALAFTPKPGWHGYWKNPGDAGIGTQFRWSLPKGVTAGAARYPVPEKLIISGLMNHVYNGSYALLIPLSVPAGIPSGNALPVRLTADWLACTDKICVPETSSFSLNLVVGDGTVNPASAKQFGQWRDAMPRSLGAQASYALVKDRATFAVPLPASVPVSDAWFFAETPDVLAYAAPQKFTRDGDRLLLTVLAADSAIAGPIRGVLAIKDGPGLEVLAMPGAAVAMPDEGGWKAILLALAGAIAGGLLLNIMPCVFPVISLKALSLARAGGDEGDARRDAIAYTAGAVLACLTLGGALLALRAGGQAVGWAFQLQDTRFILFLLLLVVAITANLVGLFELKSFGGGERLAGSGGPKGSFWTGVLAAFVATPCTGPFMAAALGAALVLPIPAALAIFAGLGLGLALPFLLIGFVPALRARMPKPGPWMGRFQRWMAVPMAITALALIWLLWRQGGGQGLAIGLGASALLIALILFSRRKWPFGIGLFAGLGVLAGISVLAAPLLPTSVSSANKLADGHVRFDVQQLEALRKAGKPVFLYFTADWCLTCKVNEAAALERDTVQASFAQKSVTVMVGDWTLPDQVIARFLESRGRTGIPLYLYYPAGGGEPTELPQILTADMLMALGQR